MVMLACYSLSIRCNHSWGLVEQSAVAPATARFVNAQEARMSCSAGQLGKAGQDVHIDARVLMCS